MRFRIKLVAFVMYTVLTVCTRSHALVTLPDMDILVERSKLCVVGKIVSVGQVEEKEDTYPPYHWAMVEVERTIFGKPEGKTIKLWYGQAVQDQSKYELGERFLFFLWPLRIHGYTSVYMHWGAFKLHGEGIDIHPDMQEPPKVSKLSEMIQLIQAMRGLSLSIQPVAGQVSCDQPMVVDVTFDNQTGKRQILWLPKDTRRPYGFSWILMGREGMPLYFQEMGLAQHSATQEPNPEGEAVELAQGQSVTRRLELPAPLHDKLLQSVDGIRQIGLIYNYSQVTDRKPKEIFCGRSLYSDSAVLGLKCVHTHFENSRGRSGNGLSFSITNNQDYYESASRFVVGEPIKVGLLLTRVINKDRRVELNIIESSVHSINLYTADSDVAKELISRFVVTRDGSPVPCILPPSSMNKLNAFLGEETESIAWDISNMKMYLPIDQAFDFSQPGQYRIRLRVPPQAAKEQDEVQSNELIYTVIPSAEKK